MGGQIGRLLGRKPPETPIKGVGERVKNIALTHFRGILGVLLTIGLLSWQLDFHDHATSSVHLWVWMFIFYLFQPVTIQVTGMIPVFALPMWGLEKTQDAVKHYWNEGLSLFIMGGMLNLLLNNSGLDRRVSLGILCKGPFSPIALLFKASAAAFIMSALSHRLIVASTLIQYITPVFTYLESSTVRYKATEPNYREIRYIINNGIQTSCSIGGTAIVHASYCTLAFRAIFAACVPKDLEYPDVLNYLQYTAFAVPLAIVMFIVNFAYHVLLLVIFGGKKMTEARQNEIGTALKKNETKVPGKITNHEKWTILFTILSLVVLLGRFNTWTSSGWATFSIGNGEKIPKVKDATTAAIFVILLHVVPRSYGFLKIITAKKKTDLPPLKPESAILFWRFVDKNTNYAYFFVVGGGISLWSAANRIWVVGEKETTGASLLRDKFDIITNKSMDFQMALLFICLLSVVLCNIMSGMAAVSIWLPLVLCFRGADADSVWVKKLYSAALGVGIGSSMGFMSPFLYTPAYFCHHTGKVPIRAMIKYSFVACILVTVIIWLGTAMYAPMIFGDSLILQDAPSTALPYGATTTTTTEAPAGGGAAEE